MEGLGGFSLPDKAAVCVGCWGDIAAGKYFSTLENINIESK
jgi:hypothetical protein